MRETDLYEPVRDWLISAGWKVRAEVADCDVAAMDALGQLVLVELKTSLNFEVVLQAADRQRLAERVYIAVPAKQRAMASKRWNLVKHLLKRLELGLLLVRFPAQGRAGSAVVEEAFPPVPFDRARSMSVARKRRNALIKEFATRSGDHNRGGSSKRALVTVYREEALRIARCLDATGPTTPRLLREQGTCSMKTANILRDNHYGWFTHVSRGLYELSQTGREALRAYSSVLAAIGDEKKTDPDGGPT